MSCGDLCLLSDLANIDFTQFKVIAVGRVTTEGPNLVSGLQSSWRIQLHSYESKVKWGYYTQWWKGYTKGFCTRWSPNTHKVQKTTQNIDLLNEITKKRYSIK